jgi:hypothetical protein
MIRRVRLWSVRGGSWFYNRDETRVPEESRVSVRHPISPWGGWADISARLYRKA